MKLLQRNPPVASGNHGFKAEALIREAKQRERRRRGVWVGVVVVAAIGLSVGIAVTQSSTPTVQRVSTTAAFVRLANHGLEGDYEAAYRLTGELSPFPGPEWTVVVAHRGPSSSTDWMLDGGTWSFFLHAGHGFALQWIEHGDRYEQCWRWHAKSAWTCGSGTTVAGDKGRFLFRTVPFVPGTVAHDVGCATLPGCDVVFMGPPRVALMAGRSAKFGKLTCMTDSTRGGPPFSVTWCLTSRGLPATENTTGSGTFTWRHLALISTHNFAPGKDFRLISKPLAREDLPPA